MSETISTEEKLLNVQFELKAPKNQRNSFGNYNYRSCEDIVEAVKPLCKKWGLLLTISDEIVLVGNRYYVRALAKVTNIDDPNDFIAISASARESESKKGMDDSQITGSTSSYARKYALNGLFAIDDTKDADTMPPEKGEEKTKPKGSVDAIKEKLLSANTTEEIDAISKGCNQFSWTAENMAEFQKIFKEKREAIK